MKLKFLAYQTYCWRNADVIDVEKKDIIDTIELELNNFHYEFITVNVIERLLPKCEDTDLYEYYVYAQLLYQNKNYEFTIYPYLKFRYLFFHPTFCRVLRNMTKLFYNEAYGCKEFDMRTPVKYKLTVYKRRKFFSLQEYAYRSIVSNGLANNCRNLLGNRVFYRICDDFYDFYRLNV